MAEVEEGLCAQILHIGPFETEPTSFAVLDDYIKLNGYERKEQSHKEIYLKDARKTDPDKLQTLLRYWIKKAEV